MHKQVAIIVIFQQTEDFFHDSKKNVDNISQQSQKRHFVPEIIGGANLFFKNRCYFS